MAKKLTSNKAKEILTDGEVHGYPLTDKQKRFFGAIAGGAPIKPKSNGWLNKFDDGGPIQENYNDYSVSAPEGFQGDGFSNVGRNYSPAWGGQFAMGGSLPGAVGFTYARTVGAAPSNGPYAKKTLPSAQNGQEMKYYQEGLDWKPKSISKDGIELAQEGKLLPKIGSKEAYELEKARQNRSDNTRAVPAQVKGTRESLAEERKQELAERTRKRKDPGTFSKGNYAIEESLRAFPESQGGLGELFDETINPAYFIGRMASNLGNAGSKAYNTGDFSALPLAIAEPLVAGAFGLDPLGSAMKVPGRVAQSMESGVLSNTHKINPWAFKPNPEAYYRMLGKEGYTDALESGVLRSKQNGLTDKVYFNKGDVPDNLSKGIRYDGPYMAEIKSNPITDIKMINPRSDASINYRYTYDPISIQESNVKLYKKDWLRGYKEVPKPTSVSSSVDDVVDFSKYPSQLEAVQARAERLLSQKNKKGWNEQLTPDLEERLSTAVQRHDVAGDYPGTSLGTNRSGRTETLVSKDANIKGVPLTEPQKSMIAAHETGHYYSNSLKEGTDWQKYFDFSDLPYKTSKYLKGKSNYSNFSNEIRERAAQLKDYIAFKNRIPLNQDFKITRAQLDDALENYVKNTGLDNTMTPFIQALKTKGNISGFLKEMNKRPLSITSLIGIGGIGAGAGALQQKKEGGIIKDDMGYWNPDNHGKVVEISSPDITMEGVDQPLLGISDTGDTKLMQPGKNYKFKGKKVTEYPVAKNGVNQQDQKTLEHLDQLTNFTNYNKPQPGGWLNKYN